MREAYERLRSVPFAFSIACAELLRQHEQIVLIASEEVQSPEVQAARATVLNNKYGEGEPGDRYYKGCEHVDDLERATKAEAVKVFGVPSINIGANVQAWCGSNANLAVYIALQNRLNKRLKDAGEAPRKLRILGSEMSIGHLTHGSSVSCSSLFFDAEAYTVREDGTIDMEDVANKIRDFQPDVVVVGFSAYNFVPDYAAFVNLATGVGAVVLADIAHIAGLVAAGLHPNPFSFGVQFVTMTTHKTMHGPRGGIILALEEFMASINRAVFPFLQGGPDFGKILATYVNLMQIQAPEFKAEMQHLLDVTAAMAQELMRLGLKVVGDGTENHLFVVDLRPSHPSVSGRQVADALDLANLSTSPAGLHNDPRPPKKTSGFRVGGATIARRGFTVDEAVVIAGWIFEIIDSNFDEAVIARIKAAVIVLCDAHPLSAELMPLIEEARAAA